MRFTAVPARTARANRSEQAVSGTNLRLIDTTRGRPADIASIGQAERLGHIWMSMAGQSALDTPSR